MDCGSYVQQNGTNSGKYRVIIGSMLKQSQPKETALLIMKDKQGVDPRDRKENCKYLK